MAAPAAPLVMRHVLDFPGGYTRSTGPVIGRFLTGLRDRRILGVKRPDGRVLVPPTEYDPETSAALGESDSDWVEVGPAGVVTTWSWVPEPRDEHPLDRPFAWALIRLDGADSAMLHAVDVSGPDALRTGMRVRPRWRDERVGHIRDLECFEPGEASTADGESSDGDAVTMMTQPLRLSYDMRADGALERFLRGIAEARILGSRCSSCGKVYVPMRSTCPAEGLHITEEIPLPDTGVLTTFAINNLPAAGVPEVPYVSGYVLLDGADIALLTLISGIPHDQVRMGMRVRAVWVPPEERKASMSNIKWFTPTGEPDVPFESYREYV